MQCYVGYFKKDYCAGQLSLWNDNPEARIRLALAGVQGGKTEAGCTAFARVLRRNRNELFMVVAPTYKILTQATMLKLEEVLRNIHPKWILKRDEKIRMEWRDRNGNIIFFRSADNPDYLRGPTLKAVFFDECAMVPTAHAYRILYQRVAVKKGTIWMTTTPKGANWLLREVIKPWEKGDPNFHVAKWRSIDNPVFPREVYENAVKYQDPRWVAQEYDAEITGFGGLVFPEFNEDIHVGVFPYREDLPVYWGVDFGIANPTYIGFFQIDPETKKDGMIYMIDELQLRDMKFDEVLNVALNEKPYPKPELAFCDPSGRYREKIAGVGTIDIMTDPTYGFDIPVVAEENWNTHQMRMAGINELHKLLKTNSIMFHRDKCWNMIRAFGLYSRKPQEEGKPAEELPIKDGVSDHPMESTFYFTLGRPRFFYDDTELEEIEPSSDYTGF